MEFFRTDTQFPPSAPVPATSLPAESSALPTTSNVTSHPSKRPRLEDDDDTDSPTSGEDHFAQEYRFAHSPWDRFESGIKELRATLPRSQAEKEEILHAHRRLQLARASRETCAAKVQYRFLRVRELEAMRAIAISEYEDAVTLLKHGDHQIVEEEGFLKSMGERIPPQVSCFQAPSKTPGSHSVTPTPRIV